MKQKAFTIIELLVVIAMMNLLSSIILVSLRGARAKAVEKAAMQFSSVLHNSLGSEAVGIWTFDNIQIQGWNHIVKDESGYAYDGRIMGTYSSVANGVFNKAINLDTTGSDPNKGTGAMYVPVLAGSPLALLGGRLTIDLWARPTCSGSCASKTFYLLDYRNCVAGGHLFYYQNGNLIFQNGNGQSKISCNINLQDSVWHNLVVSFDNIGQLASIYVNGKEQTNCTKAFNGVFTSGMYMYIGNSACHSSPQYFKGVLDDVRIYSIPIENQ